MYFSVAEQEVGLKGAAVRFAVDRADTSKVVLTVLAPSGNEGANEEQYRLTFARNGTLLASLGPEELTAEREEAAKAAKARADAAEKVAKVQADKAKKAEVHDDGGKQADYQSA